jgi:hypothetical protein
MQIQKNTNLHDLTSNTQISKLLLGRYLQLYTQMGMETTIKRKR